MPYFLYLGLLYSGPSPTPCDLPWTSLFLRCLLFGLSLGLAYLPYIAFFHLLSAHLIQALVLTVLLPLSLMCFLAAAFFEKHIYEPLGISWNKFKLK
jgi:hypothetical protein